MTIIYCAILCIVHISYNLCHSSDPQTFLKMNSSMNYNSTSSNQYTLQITNEPIETNLPPDELSSAKDFTITLNPTLNLNQLSYMQSLDWEVALENLQIDSNPLVFQSNETIDTYLHIPPELARDNFVMHSAAIEKKNKVALGVNVTEYHSTKLTDAIEFINNLLQKGSNLFIITGYAEVLFDSASIIQENMFRGLQIDLEITIWTQDLLLLAKYIDIALFSRLKAVEFLNAMINPERPVSQLVHPDTFVFNRGVLTKESESKILERSNFLNTINERRLFNKNLNVASNPMEMVNFTDFYDIDLSRKSRSSTRHQRNQEKINEQIQRLQSSLNTYLNLLDKLTKKDGKLLPPNVLYIEEMISNNIKILSLGKKLHELIHVELEKLQVREGSKLFSRSFLAISLDHSLLKCQFFIDRNKLAENCSLTAYFPPIVSYKLGSNRDISTHRYNSVRVGPITMNAVTNPFPKITNIIMNVSQRLAVVFAFSLNYYVSQRTFYLNQQDSKKNNNSFSKR